MEDWELVARECIRDTVARYNHAGDSGRFDDMVACFTESGGLIVVGSTEHFGRAALRDFFSGVGATAQPGFTHLRHCVTNVLIDVESPEAAAVASYFQVLTDIGVDHWGRYRDRFVPADGGWRIEQRSVKTDGYAPKSFFA